MGDKTYLRLGDSKHVLDENNPDRFVSRDTIKFKLDDRNIEIGTLRVQIIKPLMLGKPKKEHDGFVSNNASINLCPKLKNLGQSPNKIRFSVEPNILDKQESQLILTAQNDTGKAYSIEFSKENLQAGVYSVDKPTGSSGSKYLVRVKVDNLYSQISDDYQSPNIDI